MITKSKARCAGADGNQNPASVKRERRLSGGGRASPAVHANQQHSPSHVVQTPRAGRKKKSSGWPSKMSTPIKMKSSQSKSKYHREKQAQCRKNTSTPKNKV